MIVDLPEFQAFQRRVRRRREACSPRGLCARRCDPVAAGWWQRGSTGSRPAKFPAIIVNDSDHITLKGGASGCGSGCAGIQQTCLKDGRPIRGRRSVGVRLAKDGRSNAPAGATATAACSPAAPGSAQPAAEARPSPMVRGAEQARAAGRGRIVRTAARLARRAWRDGRGRARSHRQAAQLAQGNLRLFMMGPYSYKKEHRR